jgi:hypothetical protein
MYVVARDLPYAITVTRCGLVDRIHLIHPYAVVPEIEDAQHRRHRQDYGEESSVGQLVKENGPIHLRKLAGGANRIW